MNENTRMAAGLIRYPYGLVLMLAGLDKVFSTNLIVYWPKYISPFVLTILGQGNVGPFLIAMGVIEVVVGVMMIALWPRAAAWLGVIWLALISVNLVLLGTFDVAIRDILLAFALAAMALLEP